MKKFARGSADFGNTMSTIDRVSLGGVWTWAAHAGCDITIAYAAVLKQSLSVDVWSMLIKRAQSKFGLR